MKKCNFELNVDGTIRSYTYYPLDETKKILVIGDNQRIMLNGDQVTKNLDGSYSLNKQMTEQEFFARRREMATYRKELKGIEDWFKEYDTQVIQYARHMRLNEHFNKDLQALDHDAKRKAERMKELRNILKEKR